MTDFGIVLIDDLRSFKDPDRADLVLRTEKEALEWARALTTEDSIAELWFDHDLGVDDTGDVTSVMSIVSVLEELAFFDKTPTIERIFVHTSNPVGGKQIEVALARFFDVRRVYAGDHFVA